MPKESFRLQFQLQAPFETIQALRRALTAPAVEAEFCSRLSETATAYLVNQLGLPLELQTSLKVAQPHQPRARSPLPTPKVVEGVLSWVDPDANRTNVVGQVGSRDWFDWLEQPWISSFRYEAEPGAFTAIKEKRRGRLVWYAHRRCQGHLNRLYLGPSQKLTLAKLAQTARQFSLLSGSPSRETETVCSQEVQFPNH
jgi:hypothetical protein